MGEGARTALAPAQAPATAQMAAVPCRGGRSHPRRQSDVGHAQDRSPPEARGASRQRLQGGAHPQTAYGPRRRPSLADPAAKRLAKGRKAKAPGELVQIDTLFVNVRPDRAIKHFTAYDPVAKWTVGHVATAASASAAKDLLDKLIESAPFKVRGVQVDGGSEFMAAFEDHCRDKGLELVVLPPKRPDLNGCVERAQSSWRYEFYASYDLPRRIDTLQLLVDAFAHRYNHHRPHQALGDLTPAEYLSRLCQETHPSHMS